MYETEVNSRVESIEQVPADVIERFRTFRSRVAARTVLPWGEHCTECVEPTCYTTCDLYAPREDGRCRRFIDGMVRLDCPGTVNSYLLKVRFKRWGKLWSPGNVRLYPLKAADRVEKLDRMIGSTLYQLPVPHRMRKFAVKKRYSWKGVVAQNRKPSFDAPDSFVVECFNPEEQPISLSVTIKSADSSAKIPFQRLMDVAPGFHREEILVSEISKVIDLRVPFKIDLTPNEVPDGTTLFFGLIDFVRNAQREVKKVAGLKCVVWDLDNTLWDGILTEDGVENLVLKNGVLDVIRELDRRGILNSVASKNNFDEAIQVLKKFGIEEYFLYPQISWAPKSEALKAIARKLNIGADTLLLVDDSDFELAQVKSACPEARVLKADRYHALPNMPECQVPVTAESQKRRKLYHEEAIRQSFAEGFGNDYISFLRASEIEMRINPLTPANLERVHELTQRTNQMNFSGNRYDREVLKQVAATAYFDTYVIDCRDRFGNYGIVGFSIVDKREPRMTDLMFSCRIQGKRVEHAFLTFLMRKYVAASQTDFHANYRKTIRNAPTGVVFQDLGMEERGEQDGVTSLVFRKGREIPDDGVVRIVTEGLLQEFEHERRI